MIQELKTEQTIEEATEQGRTIIDFYAPWCNPCSQMEPVLEEFAEDNSVGVVKVDVDQHPNTAQNFGVRSVPTFVAFEEGDKVSETVGTSTHQELADLFE